MLEKVRGLCNAENKGSRFALSERRQTSKAYQLHEEAGNCECLSVLKHLETENRDHLY